MNNAENKITLMQFIFIIFGVQISVGLLSLPRDLAKLAGTDGWMAVIMFWIIEVLGSLIIIQVMKRHPEDTLPDLMKRYFGNGISKAATVLYCLWIIYYGYAGLIRTILYTKAWLLPQTPAYIIMILYLIPTYIIARNGLCIIGRYAELVFLISLWIPFVYLLPLKDARLLHLLPILKEGWGPIFSALPACILSFSGNGVAFILYPFLQTKHKAALGIVISNTLTMLALVAITLICFVLYSPDEITEFNEPVVNALKVIEFKFIERIEILFFTFFLFMFSLSWIPTLYLGVFCTSWLLGKQDWLGHLRFLCLFIAAGTYFFMPTFNQSDRIGKVLSSIGPGVEYIFPVCFLVYMWLQDRFRRRKNT